MRASILFSVALAGFVAASPVASPSPQDINIDEIEAAPVPAEQGPAVNAVQETPTYNPVSAAVSAAAQAATDPVSLSRRRNVMVRNDVNAPCATQPDGYGPTSVPDTPDSFLADPQYANIANAAPVPQGYSQTFSNLQGSTEGNGYLGLYTLKSFDTVLCQQYCDVAPNCYSINVYMEHDPSVNPADACLNPSSITNYKCTLWGLPINAAGATNKGQWRRNFNVVIAGSNGYTKLAPPPAQSGFDGPTELGGAIQAPNSYMGMKFYPGPYDPSQCAAACTATTAYDHRHARTDGTYDACNFFNSYVLSKNNVPQGTYCSMYTKAWAKSYSTNYGQYRGSDHYTVSQSYAYTLNPQDVGHV